MNRTRAAGLTLTSAGVAGYLVGLTTAYPGRAFSVTAVMVGVTLAAIGGGGRDTDSEEVAT